jgi:protein-tyrosine phosphatase
MRFICCLQSIILLLLTFLVIGCDTDPRTIQEPAVNKFAAEPTVPERHIILDGQPNFRDLGGYVTNDGKTVKWGEVYRSGELPRLSDSDVARIEGLGIQTVVSFLTSAEVDARGSDRLPPGINKIALPMEAGNLGDLTTVVNEARNTGDFSEVSPEVNPEIHRRLMTEAQEYYASLLRELADPANRPLVFHCSHGIHRTGTAAAILLSVLGVPWETIREDYLLSNDYRQKEIARRVGQLKQLYAENNEIPVEEVDSTNIEAFYILQGAYIDAALEQAVMDYGSMSAYVRDGLGLADEEVALLRRELLED